MKSWLFNRDPYNGLLQSPYNWVGFHPLYTAINQGFGADNAWSDPLFMVTAQVLVWGPVVPFHKEIPGIPKPTINH